MSPAIHKLTTTVTDNPAVMTYAGAGAAATFWGLHIGDWAVLISAFAAVLGVLLQFYVSMRRLHLLERDAAASKVVVEAMAQGQRAVATKVETLEQKQSS